jgi:hypothetical protein
MLSSRNGSFKKLSFDVWLIRPVNVFCQHGGRRKMKREEKDKK